MFAFGMSFLHKSDEYTGHQGPVYALSKGLNKGEFYSAGSDGLVVLWDQKNRSPKAPVFQSKQPIYSLSTIDSLELLLIGSGDGKVEAINACSNQPIKTLTSHRTAIYSMEVNPTQTIACTSDANGNLAFWSLPDLKLIQATELQGGKIRQILWLNDAVWVGVQSGNIFRLDPKSFQIISSHAAHDKSVYSLSKHPSKPVVLSGGADGMLCAWHEEKLNQVIKIPAHQTSIYDIQVSTDGSHIATASRDKTVKIWKSTDLTPVQKLDRPKARGHMHSVNKLLWLDDDTLLSTGDDGKIIQWISS